MASYGLSIPPPQDSILFVDTSNYLWGILDEVATTAAHVGKYHMGLAACDKLLSEPHLPEEHRERVKKNRELYVDAVGKMQNQLIEQQQKILEKVKEKEQMTAKTTLQFDPKKVAVKL
jgi:hypothetical protein